MIARTSRKRADDRPALGMDLLTAFVVMSVFSTACRAEDMLTEPEPQVLGSAATGPNQWVLSFTPDVDPDARASIELATEWATVLMQDAGYHHQIERRKDWYASRRNYRKGRSEHASTVVSAVRDWTPEQATTILVEHWRGSGVARTAVATQTIRLRDDREDLDGCPDGVNSSLVNTMLHERMHLIPYNGGYRFEDGNHFGGWRANAVSYQVGNVGQCYLDVQLGGAGGWGSRSSEELDALIDECMSRQNGIGNLIRVGVCHPRPTTSSS
jgi:hypothetical protein